MLHQGLLSISGGPRLEVHELVNHHGGGNARAYALALHLHAESPLGRARSPFFVSFEMEAFTHVAGHSTLRGLFLFGLGAKF